MMNAIDKIWIVGYENNNWWCANRSPISPPLSSADTCENAMRSAQNEASLLMMKHWPKRDMSRARIVSHPCVGFGMPTLVAPEYIDHEERPRQTPEQVWIIEAPTRYQALKIAAADYARGPLEITI